MHGVTKQQETNFSYYKKLELLLKVNVWPCSYSCRRYILGNIIIWPKTAQQEFF